MGINILANIENILLECSENEKKIALFILNNPKKVIDLSVKEVADLIGTSTASMSRFSKKLGLNNYKELKQYLLVEVVNQEKDADKYSIEDKLSWDNSYEDMQQQMLASINAVCKETLDINPVDKLMDAIEAIKNANVIYFFALGSRVLSARDLQHKLMRLGKRCIFLEDNNYGVQNLIQADERDLLIVVSFDGSHSRVVSTAKHAKYRKIKILSITKVASSRLKGLSDYCVCVPNIAVSDASLSALFRRYGQLTAVDLLYVGLAKMIYPDPNKEIEKYNKTVEKFTTY